jgi:hypothetical protein
MRELIARIDRHLCARTLRNHGRRQSDDAAADDGDFLRQDRHRLADRNLCRSPRKRPSAAAMAVIVDDQSIADLLGLQPRSLRTERADAAFDVDDLVDAHPHRHEQRRAGWRSRRAFYRGRAALQACQPAQRERSLEQIPAVPRAVSSHRLPPVAMQHDCGCGGGRQSSFFDPPRAGRI